MSGYTSCRLWNYIVTCDEILLKLIIGVVFPSPACYASVNKLESGYKNSTNYDEHNLVTNLRFAFTSGIMLLLTVKDASMAVVVSMQFNTTYCTLTFQVQQNNEQHPLYSRSRGETAGRRLLLWITQKSPSAGLLWPELPKQKAVMVRQGGPRNPHWQPDQK